MVKDSYPRIAVDWWYHWMWSESFYRYHMSIAKEIISHGLLLNFSGALV